MYNNIDFETIHTFNIMLGIPPEINFVISINLQVFSVSLCEAVSGYFYWKTYMAKRKDYLSFAGI